MGFLLTLPVLISVTGNFVEVLRDIPSEGMDYFLRGAGSLFILHLFILEIRPVYEFGQKTVATILKFSPALASPVTLILPIYCFFFLVVLHLAQFWFDYPSLIKFCLFAVGFSLSLHLVYTADALRGSGKGDLTNYYFSMSLIYILDLLLVLIWLDLIFENMPVSKLAGMMWSDASQMYHMIYKHLFVWR